MSDTVWDIKKEAKKQASESIRGSMSTPVLRELEHPEIGRALDDVAGPGGFRRHFLGVKKPGHELMQRLAFVDPRILLVSSYGGEDDEAMPKTPARDHEGYSRLEYGKGGTVAEMDYNPHGTGTFKSYIMIAKAFMGTGVLFLPNAFKNGGLGFSAGLLVLVSILSVHCMMLLIDCKRKYGGTYGSLGCAAVGEWGQRAVDISIVLSQWGFCCAYFIFVGQNCRQAIYLISKCDVAPEFWVLVLFQLPVVVPLTWVRRLEYFSISNLLADVFIVIPLITIAIYGIYHISAFGTEDVEMINARDFPLFIGTSVYAFEGIALVIPMYDAVADRKKYKGQLCRTLVGITMLFIFFGGLNYIVYGKEVRTAVTLNLPGDSWISPMAQIVYCVALILSFPIVMFPVLRILESKIWAPAPPTLSRKWKKNCLRATLCFVGGLVGYVGGAQFDNFIALLGIALPSLFLTSLPMTYVLPFGFHLIEIYSGSLCCVPLAFIYPPLFHLKLLPESPKWLITTDKILILFGVITMGFTAIMTVISWLGAEDGTPQLECPWN